ncbi:Centrosomal protein [Tetrabaena socialis]|uniref:Centrosomal protein n=1 Tax=Tetrabaena socialis TaxID=47790 RepID=A0A2J8AJD9_9CHLO|nr:Centrosomal protein [Tetrabaena socialis]|eukprot:PNH12628.1 Centrosomal protein [Tetrabaena socialis]
MKATGGPQKLRFTVQTCSGEDTDYPVRELLYHSPQTRGWQSPRFCKYPQEIVLRLENTCKVQQIQILSHEYKGREDVGRPLLERALIIQESALGPDHPDVLAIKDVLNSE